MTKEIVHISHYNTVLPRLSFIERLAPYVMLYHETMIRLQIAFGTPGNMENNNMEDVFYNPDKYVAGIDPFEDE